MCIKKVPADLQHLLLVSKAGKDYSTFNCKCFELQRQIANEYGLNLSPRQLDNLLIEVANKKGITV